MDYKYKIKWERRMTDEQIKDLRCAYENTLAEIENKLETVYPMYLSVCQQWIDLNVQQDELIDKLNELGGDDE